MSRSEDRVTIRVDGTDYEIPAERNLLHACLSLGLDLPYFCWHPAMDSVGACRQCAVKQFEDGDDDRGTIVMACMTPADDGTRISIEDREARDFRARVIEWLMVNHPHDCPVCDEGGECHLQDMTVMTGHNERRYRFDKRTHRNQDLGPFIGHEMNRCIACYRCVRFYRDHAGGRDLHALGSHHNVYFGRHEDGTLESELSGNLVEVCPTGVFTDKTLKRHYTRKWDLTSAPSVCVHCGLGCNTFASERYGGVRRILNRYHRDVNGYFLCDRGRFGYEFANRDDRVRTALARRPAGDGASGELEPVEAAEVTGRLGPLLADGARVWGIGSPRASLEANFALKTLVGEERFSTGLALREHELAQVAVSLLRRGPLPTPSLERVRRSDGVLILGEDPSDTAPILALALRQAARQGPLSIARELGIPDWHDAAVREAVQDRTGPFFVAATHGTRLDDLATETLRAEPDRIARLGAAVARALDEEAPEVPDLTDDERQLAGRIAAGLREAERPVVVSGTGAGSRAVMEAAANVTAALAKVHEGDPSGLVLTVPECDTLGVTLLGGRPLDAAFDAVEAGEADAVVVLENDLFRRAAPDRVEAFLEAFRGGPPTLVAIDHLLHATAGRADLVLPAATFAEGDGTFVSSEGRAQRAFQVYAPEGTDLRESWRWIVEIGRAAGGPGSLEWKRLDDAVAAVAGSDPVFGPLPEVAPGADARPGGLEIPRQPARFSGRTAMHADRSVHEPEPPRDEDAAMTFSMEGTRLQPPPALNPRYWAPGWNSVQALNRFQEEVAGPLRGGDPGRRLIEPAADAGELPYLELDRNGGSGTDGTDGTDGDGGFTVVPVHHVFGAEELSAKAPAVAERAPEPRLALHPDDAAERLPGAGDGDPVEVVLPEGPWTLRLRLRDDLPRGVAGFPVGMPGVPYRCLPAPGDVRPGRKEGAP